MVHCVFCQIVQRKAPAQIVYEDSLNLAFLDRYPQTRGHLQLIPKKHYRWVYEIPKVGEFFVVASRIIRGIIPILGADHVIIATHGHEIEHAHLWIVPQYKREVRIQEFSRSNTLEDPKELAKKLRHALHKGGA